MNDQQHMTDVEQAKAKLAEVAEAKEGRKDPRAGELTPRKPIMAAPGERIPDEQRNIPVGKTKPKKKRFGQQLKEAMFTEDIGNGSVTKYVFFNVMIPAVKRVLSEMANTAINMALGLDPKTRTIGERTHTMDASRNGATRVAMRSRTSLLEDYEWDEESDKMFSSGESQLKLDIVSGNAPDMIISYTNSLSHTLGSKGTFVDLNEYLGKDGAVSKEDIVPTVLNMCEENGKLYSICSGFGIQTFAAKKKYVDKENWSLDDFIEAYDKLPKDMKLFSEGNGRDQVFSYLILGLDIYDPATNKINVDTPEFVKLLEFCNQFSEEEGFDWEHASQSEMENYWNETEAAVRNDKALLYDLYLSDPRSFAAAKQGYIGEDMTLVGIPSVNGGGAQLMSNAYMFILSSSEYKDTCWDFIKGFFDEEYQTSDNMYYLPALKSAFETKLDESMKKPHYTDDSGTEIEYDDMVYIGGKEIKIDPLTKEERDFVADYIANAKNPSIGSLSDDVLALAAEEVQAYFKGERSAEETAKLIQSRAEIMLSEQS